jgi:hypothetical protein
MARTITEMIAPQISEADATLVDVYGFKSKPADQLIEWERKNWFGQTHDRIQVGLKTIFGGLTDKEIEKFKPAIRSITKNPRLAGAGAANPSALLGIPALLGMGEEYEGQRYIAPRFTGLEPDYPYDTPNLLDMYYGYEDIPFKQVPEGMKPKKTYDWAKDLPIYDITNEITVYGKPFKEELQNIFSGLNEKDWNKIYKKIKEDKDIFQLRGSQDKILGSSKGGGDLSGSSSEGAGWASMFQTDWDLGREFNLSMSEDEEGRPYVSLYDTFDFKAPESWSKKGFDVLERAGTPMQLYGRWYLDEFENIPMDTK